jgi:hypothetical protein
MEGEVKDFTRPMCRDCMNRVFRIIHIASYDPESSEVREKEQECYVCRLGVLRVVHTTLYDLESDEMRGERQECYRIELDRH